MKNNDRSSYINDIHIQVVRISTSWMQRHARWSVNAWSRCAPSKPAEWYSLVWSHIVARNHEIIEQSTHTVGCLLSCLIIIQEFLFCAINKGKFVSYVTTLNRTMVLSYCPNFLLMRWLLHETTISFSHLPISSPYHQKSYVTLHDTMLETANMYSLCPVI
jgi:hypothetical protein